MSVHWASMPVLKFALIHKARTLAAVRQGIH